MIHYRQLPKSENCCSTAQTRTCGSLLVNPSYPIPPYSLRVAEVDLYRWGEGFTADLIVGCRRVSQRVSDIDAGIRRFAGCVG
jgi:hypothetical protein